MNKILLAVIFMVLTLFPVSCDEAKTNGNIAMQDNSSPTITETLDEYIGDYVEYGKFMGSVLVAKEGEVIYKKGFGKANVEWDMPNAPDTKHRIASITKQFTSMLILQLVAEKKLALHEPISSYLPDYPKKNGDLITIHHLLTHTSGIPEFDLFINFRDIERDRYRPEELMSLFADQPPRFTPGTEYAYTNPGYVVLGVIIEKITGKRYEEVLQDKIFTPLEMNNSGYDIHYRIIKNRATGYSPKYLRGEYVNTNYIDMSIPYAAGAIYSTVEDLFLWDQALYTEKLLPKEYLDLLFEKHTAASRGYYGYGWQIGEINLGHTNELVQTISHGGGINGFRTLITRIPSSKSSIILLGNLEVSPVREMTTAIAGILYGKTYNPKKSIAFSMLEVIETEGLSSALAYFEAKNKSFDYYLDQHEMNKAGYELLFADKLEEAAFVLKLNVQEFPDSFIPYDSYGEVLMLLGKKEQAIRNYEKSIELNPKSNNAVMMLNKIHETTVN